MAYEKELSRIDRDFLNETGRETLGNDVWIFDDFDSEHLRHLPMRLDMPLFALCLGGEAVISLNVAEYKIQPDTLIALMPDVILRNIEPSEDARGIFLCLSQNFAEEIMPIKKDQWVQYTSAFDFKTGGDSYENELHSAHVDKPAFTAPIKTWDG